MAAMAYGKEVAFYAEHGYLRIPQVFTPEETAELGAHLDWVIDAWAYKDAGWSGPWRKQYMDAATEKKSQLIALHDLQYYSDAWARAVTNRKLAGGSEACTYHAGPMDAELVQEGEDAGQRILRAILALDRKCEYVTLALPDGTRQVMKLGKAGRKPGEKGPPSITVF